MEDEDNASNLQNEVAWCIDQLFQSINSGKLSERKGMDNSRTNIWHLFSSHPVLAYSN